MISSDPVLDEKIKKTSEKISENMHIIANDPSLAFYRMQEHIRKVLPLIVERRGEVENLQQDLQGRCYDLEYSLSAIKSVDKANEPFKNIQELLKSAIFLKQQLKSDETKRRPSASGGSQNSSVYKRLSAHIQTTLEFSDMDFSGAIRETTSRVENMMSTARNGSSQSQVSSSSRASSISNVSVNSDVMQRSHTTLH